MKKVIFVLLFVLLGCNSVNLNRVSEMPERLNTSYRIMPNDTLKIKTLRFRTDKPSTVFMGKGSYLEVDRIIGGAIEFRFIGLINESHRATVKVNICQEQPKKEFRQIDVYYNKDCKDVYAPLANSNDYNLMYQNFYNENYGKVVYIKQGEKTLYKGIVKDRLDKKLNGVGWCEITVLNSRSKMKRYIKF